MEKIILRTGAVAAALGAVVLLASHVEFPLAWSQDIDRLDRQQLDTAIEVLEQKRRSLILDLGTIEREIQSGQRSRTLQDQQGIIKEDLTDTKARLEGARQRRIELSE